MTTARQLTIVTRQGCDLCSELMVLLQPLVDAGRASIEERDVDADAALHALYSFRVPVVLEGGHELLWGRIEPAEITAAFGATAGANLNPNPSG